MKIVHICAFSKERPRMRALAGLRSLGGSKSQSLDDSVMSAQRKSLIEAGFYYRE